MMMKKRLVAAAVASCIAVPMASQAVNLSANDTGQVLLYPYYNVNEGNVSFVSVTNTSTQVKAVKVRFREGVGSEDVFDFTLYLSPEDVWVGSLVQEDGKVKLKIGPDTSCTVPVKATLEAASFSNARIDERYDPNSDGTQSDEEVLARLSEGHVEIIEMAVLPENTDPDKDESNAMITDAVTHGDGVGAPPPDCSVPTTFTGAQDAAILQATGTGPTDGITPDGVDVTQTFANPTGGLFGNAAVFNPSSGIYFPYNAQALENFADTPIWWPQNAQEFTEIEDNPNSLSVDAFETADQGTTVPKGSSGLATLNFDLPDLSTPDYDEAAAGTLAIAADIFMNGPAIGSGDFNGTVGVKGGTGADCTVPGTSALTDDPNCGMPNLAKAQASTAALMGVALQGEYLTFGDFATDWLITFPTRYLMVADDIDDDPEDGSIEGAEKNRLVRAPFETGENPFSGQACHDVGFDYWDREEDKNSQDTGVGVSPGLPADKFALCYEVNVLALNSSGEFSASLGSKAVKADVDLEYTDGWAVMDLSGFDLKSADGTTFGGLPITGFNAVTDLVSGTEKGGVFTNRVTQEAQ